MSYIDDLTKQLLNESGKSGPGPTAAAKGVLMGAMATVNEETDNLAVSARDSSVAVAIGDFKVTLPKKVDAVDMLGKWDSTTERIIQRFQQISEREFVAVYAGQTFTNRDVDTRLWFPMHIDSDDKNVIRIHPAPATAFTLGIVFFEALDSGNVKKLGNTEVRLSGARASLGKWFPQTAALNYRQFLDHIERVKDERESLQRTLPKYQRSDIALHNAVGSTLVT